MAVTRLWAALLTSQALIACVDDAPTEPNVPPVQLAINARVLRLDRAAEYSVEVHAAYRRVSGELMDLRVIGDSRFAVPPGTSSHRVTVDIAPCLSDSERPQPDSEACALLVQLDLLDGSDSVVATANQEGPSPARAGSSVTLAPVELSPLPSLTPIILDQAVIEFVTTADATTGPGSQTVTISTSEGGTLTGISAGSITYRPSGVDWLQPPAIDQSSASSGAPATLTLQPSTTSLAPGDYSATISIDVASGASNSPQTVTVNYRVDPADAAPTMVLTPASINFGPVPRSAALPAAKQVTIQSSTGASLAPLTVSEVRYDPSEVTNWLTTNLNADGSVLTLAPGTTDLEPDTYTATVTVSSAVQGVIPRSVRVTYVVQPALPGPPARLTIALQPSALLVGQTTVATTTVTDANGTVLRSLPTGAVLSWTSSDQTVVSNPVSTGPFAASATALQAGTTGVTATLTLAEGTTIVSNTVSLTVNARQFTLSLQLGGDGAGVVTSLESRTPLISCTWDGSSQSGGCSADFAEGQAVTLRAVPEEGSSFTFWDGACAGTESAECTVTMNDNKAVIASFARSSAGSITGVTRNAVDASPIPGASVELRAGAADTSGAPLQTTISGRDGSYSFTGLTPGNYTALARAEGFIPGVAYEIAVSEDEQVTRDIILSPVLLEGQTRIVLTWGDSPVDLDAHLTGPLDIESRFHVFWDDEGSLTAEPFSALDIDDRDGNGPETITIAQQDLGVYRYSVHDYVNRGAESSSALGASGAKVQVFQDDRLIARFDVPATDGTLWTVFELNGPTLTSINSMSYASFVTNAGDPRAAATDAFLIQSAVGQK